MYLWAGTQSVNIIPTRSIAAGIISSSAIKWCEAFQALQFFAQLGMMLIKPLLEIT